MKATGIVRRIDDLGRIVVPKEIRRTLRIREGDPLEIFTSREGEIMLKKYSPVGELGEFARSYAQALAQTTEALCDGRSYAIEILCFILVFFKKINKISGIINITVCENYTCKTLYLLFTRELFRRKRVGFVFYGFINCLTLFHTINMNQRLMKLEQIVFSHAV